MPAEVWSGAVRPWVVLSNQVLLDHRWLKVREQRVRLSNGAVIDQFHLLDSPNWSAVLAVTPENQVVMVEQYRHGLGRTSRELPAGVIEPDESPLEAARRELLEETGFFSERWHVLLEVSPEPNRSSHRAFVFVALDARPVQTPKPDQSEVLRTLLLPAEALLDDVDRGVLDHGIHVAAILMAERRGWLKCPRATR